MQWIRTLVIHSLMFPFNYSIRILFSILKEWKYLQMYFYAITEHYHNHLTLVFSLTLKNHYHDRWTFVSSLTVKNHFRDNWTFVFMEIEESLL